MVDDDGEDAKRARDEALEQVGRNSGRWLARAYHSIIALEHGWTGTGEDLRLRIAPGAGYPKHHNAWGALVRHAVADEILVPTGEYRAMRTLKSHARRTPIYRRS